MDFDPSRLRRGEVLAGASAVLLLVFMFALDWYGPRSLAAGPAQSRTGWEAVTALRWLLLLASLAGLALVAAQTTRRAPALPVSLSVIVTVLALLAVLWLGYRVLIAPPPHQHVGAVLGLISACGIAYGGYLSTREEGISPKDEPIDIPTVRLDEGGS